MTILEQIIAHKRMEVKEQKSLVPTKRLEQSIYFNSPCISMSEYIMREDKMGVIAEFKKKSPSVGDIKPFADPAKICLGYMQAGASALSVITDQHFFNGSNDHLTTAREWNYCPVLRKDFVIDEYQIIEAKAIGADTVLLIASVLTSVEIATLTEQARKFGMEVILEIHDIEDLDKINGAVHLIGVNCRSLKEMKILDDHHLMLADKVKGALPLVAESGISSPEKAMELRSHGFNGLLIGSHFMRQADPVFACRKFIEKMKTLSIDRKRTQSKRA